jgi:hypothetical protein
MAPYVSVVVPVYDSVPKTYAKLLLPIDALKHVDDDKSQWFWIPSEQDAFDVSMWQITGNRIVSNESSFRRRAGLRGEIKYEDGVWDLREAQ